MAAGPTVVIKNPILPFAALASASLIAGAAFTGVASAAASAPASPSIAGVWWTNVYEPRLLPADGKPLPFTAEGKRRYEQTVAGLNSGAIIDQAIHLCLPEGMPRAMTSAYPFQIVQTPGQVTFVQEANRAYRTVRLSDKHADPDIWDPAFMGEPIAKWQGDTLVIDSTNFKADKIYLDSTGLPASDGLHLVEQVRLLDGGKTLEDRITVSDPAIFSRPWTARRTYQRRDEVQVRTDWVCGEPHRDVSSVKSARAK